MPRERSSLRERHRPSPIAHSALRNYGTEVADNLQRGNDYAV